MHALVAIAVALAAAWLLAEHIHLALAIRGHTQPAPRPARWPSLTVVRPVRGLDVGAEENARALLASDYPGPLEVLFVFDDADDPGYPAVRDAIAAHLRDHPFARARALFAGAPPPGRTGKLHAMGVGLRAARGRLVGFSDSDTRLDPDLLSTMVARLEATPGAGDVFAPALVDSSPRTAGDAGYAIMLNAWYGAVAAAAAGARHELPFIMGQLMIFRRETLAAIGGLECADGQLVDDMYLGQRIAQVGLHNVMCDRPLRVVGGGLSAGEFVRLLRRWLLYSRTGLPRDFTRPSWVRAVTAWIAIAGAAASFASGWTATGLLALAVLAELCASDVALHRALGGARIPLRWAWIGLAVPLLGPLVLASLFLDPHVGWRGRDYTLNHSARLG